MDKEWGGRGNIKIYERVRKWEAKNRGLSMDKMMSDSEDVLQLSLYFLLLQYHGQFNRAAEGPVDRP